MTFLGTPGAKGIKFTKIIWNLQTRKFQKVSKVFVVEDFCDSVNMFQDIYSQLYLRDSDIIEKHGTFQKIFLFPCQITILL